LNDDGLESPSYPATPSIPRPKLIPPEMGRMQSSVPSQRYAQWLAVLFYFLWLFITFVSVIDGYLALRYRDDLLYLEQNPIGRMLIQWNDGEVWYLLAAKLCGTVVVCTAVLLIRQWNALHGLIVASALAAFQLWLLFYLVIGFRSGQSVLAVFQVQ
jgi:hypothetical protein